jgi:hypothetical protein
MAESANVCTLSMTWNVMRIEDARKVVRHAPKFIRWGASNTGIVASLCGLLTLTGSGSIGATAAQEVVGQHQLAPTTLTFSEEKVKAATPGAEFKECTRGCPVMTVISPGKFVMGSSARELDHRASEDPQQEVEIAKSFDDLLGDLQGPRTWLSLMCADLQGARGGWRSGVPSRPASIVMLPRSATALPSRLHWLNRLQKRCRYATWSTLGSRSVRARRYAGCGGIVGAPGTIKTGWPSITRRPLYAYMPQNCFADGFVVVETRHASRRSGGRRSAPSSR